MLFDEDKFSDAVGEFIVSLAQESERSAVVLGAARLDTALELLLKRSLQPSNGGKDDLLDSERPLGTFSARIIMAYRLGLIDKDMEYSLQAIRKIRNSFAHSIEKETLSKTSHHDRLFEIGKLLSNHSSYKSISEALTRIPDVSKELASFCGIILTFIVWIEVLAHNMEPISPRKTISLKRRPSD